MTLSDKRKEYLYEYQKAKLKRVPLDVTKEKYDEIKAAADEVNESVNGYIKTAIDTRLNGSDASDSVPVSADAELMRKGSLFEQYIATYHSAGDFLYQYSFCRKDKTIYDRFTHCRDTQQYDEAYSILVDALKHLPKKETINDYTLRFLRENA